ncbi:hypothetical protein [Enterococcus lactis]|uniref:hypothetical protein n=1 Tax=Enterococcus lactis TaxID=357441 RepID=UPI0034E93BF5
MLIFTVYSDTKELSDYVKVNFSGMDTMGTANYSVDETKLVKDIFGYDKEIDFTDEKNLEKIDSFLKAFKIKLDKTEDLSGDKVKVSVSVDTNQTNKINTGEKIVEVQGLEETERLTSMEVEKNLDINFTGVDGRGSAQIDNVFSDFIGNIEFQIKNDSNLKNGDQPTIDGTDELVKELKDYSYILDEKFNPTFEIKKLLRMQKRLLILKILRE